jgi:hypothetical protein
LDKVLKKCEKPRINFGKLVENGANSQEAGLEESVDEDEIALKNK